MRLWEIARLTWYQIGAVYFHDRDENGDIKFPQEAEGPPTYERRLAALVEAGMFMTPAQKVAALMQACRDFGKLDEHGQPPPDVAAIIAYLAPNSPASPGGSGDGSGGGSGSGDKPPTTAPPKLKGGGARRVGRRPK